MSRPLLGCVVFFFVVTLVVIARSPTPSTPQLRLERRSRYLYDRLSNYSEYHVAALSSGGIPRLAVAKFHHKTSKCAKVEHVISMMMFALVTDRVLLIDWQEGENPFPPDFNYRPALSRMELDEDMLGDDIVYLISDTVVQDLHNAYLDLNDIYNQRVVFISGYDLWVGEFFRSKAYSPFLRGERVESLFDFLWVNRKMCQQK